MIHHIHVLLVGLAYVLGFFCIPMLLGLPLEAWGSRQAKTPLLLGRAWFIGLFFIACFCMIYFVGLLFI